MMHHWQIGILGHFGQNQNICILMTFAALVRICSDIVIVGTLRDHHINIKIGFFLLQKGFMSDKNYKTRWEFVTESVCPSWSTAANLLSEVQRSSRRTLHQSPVKPSLWMKLTWRNRKWQTQQTRKSCCSAAPSGQVRAIMTHQQPTLPSLLHPLSSTWLASPSSLLKAFTESSALVLPQFDWLTPDRDLT